MYQMIADNLRQLGIDVEVTVSEGIAYLKTNRKSLHYDEIDWIVKYTSFKGIATYEGVLVIELLA